MALLSSAASSLFVSMSSTTAHSAGSKGRKKADGAVLESERPNSRQEFRGAGPLRVYCVGAQVKPENTTTLKRSKVEIIKENSNFLRYPLSEDLLTEAPNVSESSVQLIKFHGSYQQYDREVKGPKKYSFMLRTKQAAGKVSNALYLAMDDLADEFGIGSLRLTTRQTFQLHGVLKHDLKTVMSTIVRNLGSTLGACGDVNRNVLAPPAPYANKAEYLVAQETAEKLAQLLAPQAGAYYDVWVDGEKIMSADHPDVTEARSTNINGSNIENSPEPIYGHLFLPRKFKIAVTVPGDNSVDLFTNDIGIVTIFDNDGELEGYNVYVGGGMGRTHRNEETFPRLSEPLGYVPKEDILYAVKAIVATQRDHGRRDDRKYSRLKYLLHEWGIEKFRLVTENYYGRTFQDIRELPPWKFESFLGWHEQGDGHLFYGVHIENGRITGDLKKAIRGVIEKYNLSVRLTANQNLVLCDIKPSWKAAINKTLAEVGVKLPRSIDNLNLRAIACPALPLCPLAITEAERGAPDILKAMRGVLKKVGFSPKSSMVVRFTGCPNGCTRPYMAELGLVGDGPNAYQIWLGGNANQTRLAQPFQDKVKLQDLEKFLEPLFQYWKTDRKGEDEDFGDFVSRKGFPALRSYIESYDGIPRKKNAGPRIVNLTKDTYDVLAKLAAEQQTTTSNVASKIIEDYVKSSK